MSENLSKALVRNILEHAEDFPWVLQDIGLLGLRLDDHKEYRLHVWDSDYDLGDGRPLIHDHPFSFTSTVMAGQMTNTRYQEADDGDEYIRTRYLLADEEVRRSDTVRLLGQSTTFTEGDEYHQLAHELHASRQKAGTVTIIRRTWREEIGQLTVCRRDDVPWISGQSRPASNDEVKKVTSRALGLF
jgi:hypothetical protein